MDDPRGPGDKVGNVTIDDTEPLLTPQQVAALLGGPQNGDPVGVQRADRVHPYPGGHRRFRESEIRALLAELTMPAAPTTA